MLIIERSAIVQLGMKIAFTGDVMLGRLVNSVLSNDKFTYVWGDTLNVIRGVDLSLINLECVVSSAGKEWDKTFKAFHFRAHPEAINVLKVAGIDYVSLANNHVLDYDNEALIEMLDLLGKNEIRHSGAGRNLSEAMEPAILNTNKRTKPKSVSSSSKNNNVQGMSVTKIGIVSLTDNEPEWEATENSPGINYIPIKLRKEKEKVELDGDSNSVYYSRLKPSIQKARQVSDLVIVSSHVGPHFRENPSSDYVKFAHMIIDMGADIYWGHSNHMPQGIEIYKHNKIIMYDCGDFIDDYAVHRIYRNDLSFVFLLNFEYSNNDNYGKYDNNSNSSSHCKIKEIELVPTKIYDFSANTALLEEDEEIVISRMVQRCNYLGTKNCIVVNKSKTRVGKTIKIPIDII